MSEAGGVVEGENTSISVPPGAVSGSVTITIEQTESTAVEGEWTYSSAGNAIALGPSGTTFAEPIEVTLEFEPELVQGRTDLFAVVHRDDLTGELSFLPPEDIRDNHVTVLTTSFSTFEPVVLTELMAGTVTDRDTQAPLPGTTVFFYGTGYGTVLTNEEGHYSFTIQDISSFGGGLSGALCVGTDGYFEAPSVSIPDLGSQAVLPVVSDVSLLSSPPLVSGIVTDKHTGLPLSGASIGVSGSPWGSHRGGAVKEYLTTSSDGSYAVDPSYFVEGGIDGHFSVSVEVNASGYLGTSSYFPAVTDPVIHDFELISDQGELIVGIVQDRTTHAPIAGATVFFYGSGYGTTQTDASGRYAFTGEDISTFGGSLSGVLYVGKEGYLEAAPITIPDLNQAVSLPVQSDVSLLASAPLVTGVITDKTTGLPVAGVEILFEASPMSTFRGGAITQYTQTGSDGSYQLDASYFNEEGLAIGFSASIRIVTDEYLGTSVYQTMTEPVVVDLSLISATGELLSGTVLDRDTQQPVPDATVFFYGSGYGSVKTDASGHYRFTAADLTFFGGSLSGALYFGKLGYLEPPSLSVPDLNAQPSLPLVNDTSLKSSPPLITGHVLDARTGAPVGGASIQMTRSPMCTWMGGATEVTLASTSDGSYAVDAAYFSEEGLTTGFTATLGVNATGYIGTTSTLEPFTEPTALDLKVTPATQP